MPNSIIIVGNVYGHTKKGFTKGHVYSTDGIAPSLEPSMYKDPPKILIRKKKKNK